MKGYVGNILFVDLSTGKTRTEPLNLEYARLYLGGRGLGARYLLDYLEPNIDPLSPRNVVTVMTGPLTGTPIPSVHKFEIVTKSPLTMTYLCTNVGGTFGVELKKAGYDGIIIREQATNPSYLWIHDGESEVRDARHVWGMTTDETSLQLKKEVEDEKANVMQIGPAGENMVHFACVQSEPDRSAGRGGAGAVWGSKNLKAIVTRGTGEIEVADPNGLKEYTKVIYKLIREAHSELLKWGTPGSTEGMAHIGIYPYKNFQKVLTDVVGKIDAKTWRSKFVIRDTVPCYICPLGCGKVSQVREGPYKDAIVEGPEYETIWALGANCGVLELEPIIMANMLCDKFGLDTISTGVTISFAMECYERGLITKADTDGLDMKFGNRDILIELIRKIAFREGFGNVLAMGTKQASETLKKNTEKYAIQVKGLELPAYDPRGVWGMGLGYATSCRGADHLKAHTVGPELYSGRYERFSTAGRAELVVELQNMRAAFDSLLNCIFASKAGISIDACAKLFTLVTGQACTVDDLLVAGERIYNLERIFAISDGISRKDDTLPSRILEETVLHGPAAGRVLGRKNFEKMLDEYYALRRWDVNGRPTREKLDELGLKDIT